MSRTNGKQHTDSGRERTDEEKRARKIQQFISLLLEKAIHKNSALCMPHSHRFYSTDFSSLAYHKKWFGLLKHHKMGKQNAS